MNYLARILAGLLLTFLFQNCQGQTTSVISTELSEKINNSVITDALKETVLSYPNNTQLAIGLINGDTTTYLGIQRVNDTLKLIDNKSNIFEIGSISKVFTSILLSNMVAENKLKLSDTLGSQFNFPLKEGSSIQLQQLANHTGGFARMPSNATAIMMQNPNDPFIDYTTELMEEHLKDGVQLVNEIGKTSAYSNFGMGILGYVLTKESGKTYEALLQENILKPLQMNNSTTLLKNVPKNSLVKGLDGDGKEAGNWNFTDAFVGAGGIKSSIIDLEKFVHKNLENDLVYNLPQQKTFTINEQMSIGLGWHLINKKEKSILWHNGGTAGYLSSLAINKQNKKSVIVLSNVSAFNPQGRNIDKLCFSLLQILGSTTNLVQR